MKCPAEISDFFTHFLHEYPHNEIGDSVKFFHHFITESTLKTANRKLKNELKIYLSDNEQYILEQKVKASGMKDKSSFLQHQILSGYVYDIDYSVN